MFSDSPGSIRRYLLADLSVATDARAGWLEAFRAGDFERPAEGLWPLAEGPSRAVYSGPGVAGGTVRDVRCRRDESTFLIEVEGGAPVLVSEAGDRVVRLAPPGLAPTELDLEVSFGPGLILALALRGVFCFHASCARVGRRIAAFVGESGSGKSTIARLAASSEGWERLGDDVLPIVASGEGVFVLPRFPQLKLGADEQWGADRPERLPLDAIYDIGAAGAKPESGAPPRIAPLGLREAVLRLARRTVASRLFDAALTSRQLQACEAIVERVPVRELVYGRVLEEMPAVYAALEDDLAELGGR